MVKQLSLFKQGSFNITRELKECMAAVVAGSRMSREEYLEQMNLVADRFGVRLMRGNGNGLTMATFEKWLNPADKEHIPSPSAIPVFCEVGGSTAPLQVMAGPVGAMVIGEQDKVLLQWAREYQRARDARLKMKKLEAEL